MHAGPGAPGYVARSVPERFAAHVPADGVNAGVYALADQFVRAILDGEPMSPTFGDAFHVQALIDAVRESDRAGTWQDVSPPAP
jgi:predicted dehydrogenase